MGKRIAEWYTKHKVKIELVIALLVIVFIVNRLIALISWLGNDNSNTQVNNVNTELNDSITENLNSVSLGSETGLITGTTITQSQSEDLNFIDQFIAYCNNGQIQEAYDLLSNDCKEEMYPELSVFQSAYYKPVFGGRAKQVSVENWSGNIYRILVNEDSLSTGNYSEETQYQDYITVIDQDDTKKLNINGFLSKRTLNETGENNNIQITATECNSYMDYTTYTFRVTNNRENAILLANINNINSIYIEDDNGVAYTAYLHELTEGELTVNAGATKEVTIKYYSKYGSRKNIVSIVFPNIELNYNVLGLKEYGFIQINL